MIKLCEVHSLRTSLRLNLCQCTTV